MHIDEINWPSVRRAPCLYLSGGQVIQVIIAATADLSARLDGREDETKPASLSGLS